MVEIQNLLFWLFWITQCNVTTIITILCYRRLEVVAYFVSQCPLTSPSLFCSFYNFFIYLLFICLLTCSYVCVTTYTIYHMSRLSFCMWLVSHSATHTDVHGRVPFFIWLSHISLSNKPRFLHPPVEVHIGCFSSVTAVNLGMQLSPWLTDFLSDRHMPSRELVIKCLKFFRWGDGCELPGTVTAPCNHKVLLGEMTGCQNFTTRNQKQHPNWGALEVKIAWGELQGHLSWKRQEQFP